MLQKLLNILETEIIFYKLAFQFQLYVLLCGFWLFCYFFSDF